MSGDLRDALTSMNALPDISHSDSERLQGFTRMTAVEIKAVGRVGAATSLEMIGYIRELEHGASSRDAEIKEVLSGFIHAGIEFDDERIDYVVMQIDRRDLAAARALYAKLSDDAPALAPTSKPISKPLPRKSKKQQIADELRESDLTALETDRRDIEYGHHDSLPSGEHVARLKRG